MRARRLVAGVVAGVLTVGIVTGCSSGGSDGAEPKAQRNEDELSAGGNDPALRIGNARLPKDFPSDEVPLPASGSLKAAVSGDEPKRFYSLTYGVPGGDLNSAAADYRRALRDDGYRIEASSSVNTTDPTFSAYTAIGKQWDLVVYGGGTPGADGALSLQITEHDPDKDIPGAKADSGAETG